MTDTDVVNRTEAQILLQKLHDKKALIGVIGLGYVGLPLCLALVEAGVRVLGFDVDPAKINCIMAGQSYLSQFPAKRMESARDSGNLGATTDMERLSEPDAIIICVPTPLTAHLEPDLSFVRSTASSISQNIRRGQLVILESTTYPGTTSEVLQPILEETGLVAGQDFFLAFSPEREDPGNVNHSTATIPKVIGADGEHDLALASALYESFGVQTVLVSTSSTAEAVKITENIFRAVNIALVNELKVLYQQMDIDIWEVIDAAKTKPFGFMPFYPGPGLGGHCIPIDPFYLTWKAKEFGLSTRFIELAGQINNSMPKHVVTRLAESLDLEQAKGLNGSKILVVGVAYKKNVDDTRESPALEILEVLDDRGAQTEFYDPFCRTIPPTRAHSGLAGRTSVEWDKDVLKLFDAAVIVTDHDNVDYHLLAECVPLIVDSRNACADVEPAMATIVGA